MVDHHCACSLLFAEEDRDDWNKSYRKTFLSDRCAADGGVGWWHWMVGQPPAPAGFGLITCVEVPGCTPWKGFDQCPCAVHSVMQPAPRSLMQSAGSGMNATTPCPHCPRRLCLAPPPLPGPAASFCTAATSNICSLLPRRSVASGMGPVVCSSSTCRHPGELAAC